MSAMKTLGLTGGRLIDPVSGRDEITDVRIEGDRIVAIGNKVCEGVDEHHDVTGKIVGPGLVDLCARLREPGQEYKASIRSETRAACSSGITTLCCPPDTDPVIDEPSVIDLINHRARLAGNSRVATLGALTHGLEGERLAQMWSLHDSGCVGVSNAMRPVDNTMVLRRAYAYAANCGFTVHITPNDHWLSAGGCAHEGAIATRLGLQGIPVSAETTALARAIELIADTGVTAHIGRLSSAEGVRMLRDAKANGLHVTADVSAHHLHLTEHDISNFNSDCHVLPPFRTKRDMEALREGVSDGTIDAICSDHQPHDADAKQAPFASTEPGISGLETLMPLTMKLVDEGIIDVSRAFELLSTAPANILGLEQGRLDEGKPADISVIDPDADWSFDADEMTSRGTNSPFHSWAFSHRNIMTIIGGRRKYPTD